MGIDARDCRVDVGFLLGDATIPDDVSWPDDLRDKSCVWLDFIDNQFNPCVRRRYDTCEENTTVEGEFPLDVSSFIPQSDGIAVTPLANAVCTIPVSPSVVASQSISARNTSLTINTPSITIKSNAVCTTPQGNIVVANRSRNTVRACRTNNKV